MCTYLLQYVQTDVSSTFFLLEMARFSLTKGIVFVQQYIQKNVCMNGQQVVRDYFIL